MDVKGILEKPLTSLSLEEWEALCDRCGLCCLEKLEDHERGVIYQTNVPCSLLDLQTGLCRDYDNRLKRVPDCIPVDPYRTSQLKILPETCAYRRRYENRPLPDWHPLLTGDPESPRKAGVTVSSVAVKRWPWTRLINHIIKECS